MEDIVLKIIVIAIIWLFLRSIYLSIKKTINENIPTFSEIKEYLASRKGYDDRSSCILVSREEKAEYLQSKEWYSLRQKVKSERGNRCELCFNVHNLNVHHVTYERLRHEKLSDLRLLCRECHSYQHEYYGYDRKTIYLPLKYRDELKKEIWLCID